MKKKVITRVRERGEITLPKEIRDKMEWKPDDYLVVKINNDNTIILKKIDL